jgi:hypothetical protein
MRIAYLTTDEVNLDYAARFAEGIGATLSQLFPKDPAPDGRFDAVLYDLDSLPPKERRELLSHLLGGDLPCPRGVHSYNLTRKQVAGLRRRGITVVRRLKRGALRTLASACQGRVEIKSPARSVGAVGRNESGEGHSAERPGWPGNETDAAPYPTRNANKEIFS